MDDDPADRPALTAQLLAAASQFDLTLADSVVLVYDVSLIPAKASTRRQRRAIHPFRSVASMSDGVDIIAAPGPGAPVAAITIEFLASMGVKRVISVGTAGMLATDHSKFGPHSIVSEAVSDEGTSRHYSSDLSADPRLIKALVGATGDHPTTVTTLTTDVPFRQSPKRLQIHRARASFIEMECAAVFAAAHHLGLAAGAILVASDQFAESGWGKLEAAPIQQRLRAAVELGVKALASSSDPATAPNRP